MFNQFSFVCIFFVNTFLENINILISNIMENKNNKTKHNRFDIFRIFDLYIIHLLYYNQKKRFLKHSDQLTDL